jgi:superfamily II DNA or RNA helicase
MDSYQNEPTLKNIIRMYREYVKTFCNKIIIQNESNHEYIELYCTLNHSLYILNKGWTNIFNPNHDEVLILSNDNKIIKGKIIEVSHIYYNGYVYDIEVETTHNYFANSILTHNTCLMAAVSEYAKNILPSLNKTIILVKNDTLKKNVIDDIATKCTKEKYNITLDPKTGKPLSTDSRLLRISSAISKNYNIMTYYDFAKTIKNINPSMYDNSFIIIDEAHNLRSKKMANKFGINSYKLIHNLIHTIKGSKVLLLTGTPMRNSSSEIVSLMNLILPLNQQMSEENWSQTYFNQDGQISEEGLQLLKQYFYGKVSYLRSPTGNVNITYMGDIDPPLQYTKCYPLWMERFQSEKYNIYYDKDKQKESNVTEDDDDDDDDEDADNKKSLWISSRQASCFIFPNGECGIQAEKKYLDIDYGGDTSKTRIHDYNCSKLMIDFLQSEGKDKNSMLNQLKKCSIKFWFAIKEILDYPHKKTFIYSSFVLGGGIVLFSALLKLFNFNSASTKGFGTEAYPKDKRFLLLSSKTMSTEQMRVGVREIFNSRENVDGDYIQVILGSRIIGEGISFFHIRQVFLITPSWNNATTEQILARAIRADSHPDWMSDKNLDIYRLDAKPSTFYNKTTKKIVESQSVDTLMYYTSEYKDIKIKQIERIMKTSAVDCTLNRNRNINPKDKPYSIQCDYLENCDYQCDYVDPMFYTPEWSLQHPELVITDTFYNYFAFKQIINITDKIKDLFTIRQAYDFEEMYHILKNDTSISTYLSGIVLSRTLHSMIGSNIKIKNHLGFNNYLREDNNLYFLVDDAAASTNYTSAYYAANPFYDSSYSNALTTIQHNTILNDYYNENSTMDRLFKLLNDNKNKPEIIKTILLNCDPSVSIDWIENAYDTFQQTDDKTNKNILVETIYKIFKNVIRMLEINNQLVPINFFMKNKLRIKYPQTGWIDANEQETEDIIKKRMEQIANIKSKFGYYAIIDEKDIFRIKEVAPIQFTKKGEIDSRISRELGALKCGTGKLAKGGLIYRILLISLKALEYGMDPLLETLHDAPPLNTNSKDYIDNLKPFVIRYILEQAILNNFLTLSLKKRKELLLNMYTTLPSKSEDHQLLTRSIVQAGNTQDEVYLNDDNIKAIIRELEDLTYLKDHFKIKNVINDITFINNLPENTKGALSKALKYKANTICESLNMWFQENNLTI